MINPRPYSQWARLHLKHDLFHWVKDWTQLCSGGQFGPQKASTAASGSLRRKQINLHVQASPSNYPKIVRTSLQQELSGWSFPKSSLRSSLLYQHQRSEALIWQNVLLLLFTDLCFLLYSQCLWYLSRGEGPRDSSLPRERQDRNSKIAFFSKGLARFLYKVSIPVQSLNCQGSVVFEILV